jgi:hypothetical protein
VLSCGGSVSAISETVREKGGVRRFEVGETNSVTRYELEYCDSDECDAIMRPARRGNYVLAEDYDRLQKVLEQLANNNLNSENCASVEVAAKRVRNIARAALAKEGV